MSNEDGMSDKLTSHLEGAVTTVCRCWTVTLKDGRKMGFTDHDRDLQFNDIVFSAESGMAAKSLVATTGLSVNNSEVFGILNSDLVDGEELLDGAFDYAEVKMWSVNWSDTSERRLEFKGYVGEVVQSGAQFEAEIRGISDLLNQQVGCVFQKYCDAVLGGSRCKVDFSDPDFSIQVPIENSRGSRSHSFASLGAFQDGWFSGGRFVVLSGPFAGTTRFIKSDRKTGSSRVVELWEGFRGNLDSETVVRLEAGCDKTLSTCRKKFDNVSNFRGFPHIPGEDWLTTYPRSGTENDGGSLNS